jgi:hypothetical protein
MIRPNPFAQRVEFDWFYRLSQLVGLAIIALMFGVIYYPNLMKIGAAKFFNAAGMAIDVLTPNRIIGTIVVLLLTTVVLPVLASVAIDLLPEDR